jgi:hypothetical protein
MFKNRISVEHGKLQRRSIDVTSSGRGSFANKKETANFGMNIGNSGGPGVGTMFRGILPDNSGDDASLGVMLRDIWHYDNVGGSAVDLQCGLAFSNWTLTGCDQKIAEVYNDNLSRLNMRIMLPQISRNFLVDGAFLGTLLWDKSQKSFQDVLIHDRFNATISQKPFFSLDPVVTVNSAQNLKSFLSSYSPYVDSMLKGYPRQILENYANGSNVLDPVTTLMVLRQGTQDAAATSYLRRLLPMYLLERTLFRGTVTEAAKRQRATTMITMGTDNWEPTRYEMEEELSKFQMSEMDPLGGWVVTRQGVQIQDVRPAGEIWKWTDTADTLVPYKLRALGISEAFLSSDGSYSNSESALTMFLDNLETYREFMTYKIFYSKLFPLIAVLNGFYKEGVKTKKSDNNSAGSMSDLMYSMSNQKNLIMPKIQWHKNLKSPNASSLLDNLEKLSEKGFPVALKTWAAAANVDLSSALYDLGEDAKIREDIANITKGNPNMTPEGVADMDNDSDESVESRFKRMAQAAETKPMSASAFHPKVGLLDREFDGDFRFTKTGKVRAATKGEVTQNNDHIIKAMISLQDPHTRARVRGNIIGKFGHMPKVGY